MWDPPGLFDNIPNRHVLLALIRQYGTSWYLSKLTIDIATALV